MNRKTLNTSRCAGVLLVLLAVLLIAWPARTALPECEEDIPGFQFTAVNAQGRPEYRHDRTGLIFVKMEGGRFEMGSPQDEEGRFDTEGPVHPVQIKPFLLCKTVVTQRAWKVVMGTTPWRGAVYMVNGDEYPAVHISWNDCKAFVKKAGLRLPTEAEWEYSCRAGTRTRYHFGDSVEQLEEYAWYGVNTWDVGQHFFSRVARKKPNGFGLHDMHGNVWEWCEDTWHRNYEGAPGDGTAWVDETSRCRVQRGGSWIYDAWDLRSASRIKNVPTFKNGHLGFRPAAFCK